MMRVFHKAAGRLESKLESGVYHLRLVFAGGKQGNRIATA